MYFFFIVILIFERFSVLESIPKLKVLKTATKIIQQRIYPAIYDISVEEPTAEQNEPKYKQKFKNNTLICLI